MPGIIDMNCIATLKTIYFLIYIDTKFSFASNFPKTEMSVFEKQSMQSRI